MYSKEANTAEEWILAGAGALPPASNEAGSGSDDSENRDTIERDPDIESGDPFTFEWVCRELDLNPKGVAGTIRAMPKRGNNRIAPWYFARKTGEAAKNEPQH